MAGERIRGRTRALSLPASIRTATFTAVLAVVQFCIYAVQENFERLAANASMPGTRFVAGRLATALVVHVLVALVLAVGLALLHERLHGRERGAAALERLARAINRRFPAPRRWRRRRWWSGRGLRPSASVAPCGCGHPVLSP